MSARTNEHGRVPGALRALAGMCVAACSLTAAALLLAPALAGPGASGSASVSATPARPKPGASTVDPPGSSSAEPILPRLLSSSEPPREECPLPVQVCPCVLTEPAELDVTVFVDASTSVVQGTYANDVNEMRGAVSAAAAEYRKKHRIPPSKDLCRSFSTEGPAKQKPDDELGDCPSLLGPDHNAYTPFNGVFATIASTPRDTLYVLITDGVESPPSSPALDQRFFDALASAPHALVVLKLVKGEVPKSPSEQLKCPTAGPTADRCVEVPAAESDLRDRVLSFLEKRKDVAAQERPDSDTSSVVMLGDDAGWRCTGIAVAPHVILTAAHCAVTRGRVDEGEDAGTVFNLLEQREHPSLDARLVRLDRSLHTHVLPRRTAADAQGPEGSLRFVGFGSAHAGAPAFTRRKDIPLTAAGWGCDGRRAETVGCVVGGELVLPGSGGADTCNGDSGGPVFELIPGARCTWRLVGITSRRVADGREACGSGGIYSRADVLAPWIDEALRDWKGEP